MLYLSLLVVVPFIYYLFRSRDCDCGCGQNCNQDYGNDPNNGVRILICEGCSDFESCKCGRISKPGNSPVTCHKNGNSCPIENGTKPGKCPHTPPATPIPCRRPKNKSNQIIAAVVAISITAGVSATLIAQAFFVPPMPNFALPGITVNSFDISTPNVIRANFQMRISSRNSNSLFRFYFDRLRIYVTYRDQQITFSTPLPPNAEGHDQTDTWTANVCGTPVTLEPNNAIALSQELVTGSVKVTIRIVGRVRWKFWFFPSVKHRFSVKCSASISVGTQQPQITVRKCSMKL